MRIILSADDFGRSHEMNLAIDYAMKNKMVFSTALIMGSQFTQEAVDMAFEGGYIGDVHCHLNLASGINVGNHFVPLNDEYKKSRFCKDGEFANANYYRADFLKYVDVIYQELETQYLSFREMTKNQANYMHLDFHKYLNLSMPVAVAYDRLIKKYHIQSARFFGAHQPEVKEAKKRLLVHKLMMIHWRHSKACLSKSSRIEYYLMNPDIFKHDKMIELFVHPDYRDGILIDRTASVYGNAMKSLEEQVKLVKQSGEAEFISWASLNHDHK